ncbi:MAG: hypothetical protein JWR21_786 [Herminiimonas sp.]|nr:hypothetical protein [Herminiimonas sp.]
MTQSFKVNSEDIARLGAFELTQLLKLLLHAEAGKFGIDQRAVEVALNINVADGGEDGRIQWTGAPDSTDYIPNRLTLFQNKATTMHASECASELITSAGTIKPMVDQIFARLGSYVLFTTQELNMQQKQERISRMREKLVNLRLPYALTADFQIYDASSISGWVNHFISAIVATLEWAGRPLERGLKTFSAWATTPEFTKYPFVEVAARSEAVAAIRGLLHQSKSCARIVGLSGLGKTRMAFEIFNGDSLLKEEVVYVDAETVRNVDALVCDWVSHGLTGILVIDNCDGKLHSKVHDEIRRTTSTMSVLTLDYNMENVSGSTREVRLAPLSLQEIKEMLTNIYQNQIPDLDRVAAYAQGFPQMAVLIAEARLIGDSNLGLLSDDDIAAKLLWGPNRTVNADDEKILRGCALFDKFGIDDEASADLQFIAAQVVDVSHDAIYECVIRFSERGIIDRRGRYCQLVPKPLAIRLAAQWWKRTRMEKQLLLIDAVPEAMVASFCDQIEKLDSLSEVKELTKSICGIQGPFGQAEVILSSRGSRLFRALVNINPSATESSLSRILIRLSHQDLLNIKGDVRRNLVWSLEKLCFHEHLFESAAWTLLLLASAENESWSNNAQGMFAQLFRVQLSGTAASPSLRLQLLNRAIAVGDPSIDSVVLKALKNAVDTHGGSRTIGAEYQGTAPPLQEWKAKYWQEIFDYWCACFNVLVLLVERGADVGNEAREVIGHSIRGLLLSGRLEMLDSAIRRIVELTGKYWPSALESLTNSLEYDAAGMPEEGRTALKNWLALLSPDITNVEETLRILVVSPPWEHTQDSTGTFVDVAAKRAETLADEFGADVRLLIAHLPLLLSGEQRQAYSFGRALALKANEIETLLQPALKTLSGIESPNSTFVVGVLSGVYQKSVETWERYLDYISVQPGLHKFYPDAINSGTIRAEHLGTLLRLIETGKLPIYRARSLSYGGVTKCLTIDDISHFCLALAAVDAAGAWIALEIMIMYCHGDTEKFKSSRFTLKQLVLTTPLNDKSNVGHSVMYHWGRVATELLEFEGIEYSEALCRHMIAASEDKLDHNDLWNTIKPLLSNVIIKFGEALWPLFGNAIVSAGPVERYWLQMLLERDNSFDRKNVSIFSLLPVPLVINWCREHPEIAPRFVARSFSVFKETGEIKVPSDLFVSLLENFGGDSGIDGELAANLGSLAWSGSLVPYLQSDRTALLPLIGHANPHVRTWAREYIKYLDEAIARESMRDDEETF